MKGRNVTNSKSKHTELKEGENIVLNNQTKSHKSKDKEYRCHMNLALFLNPKNGQWFLHKDSTLEHKFHYEMSNKSNALNSADLSDNEEAWIE